jgi:hypothetical protein
MAETAFNLDEYLNRIGFAGTREASLPALRGAMPDNPAPDTNNSMAPV